MPAGFAMGVERIILLLEQVIAPEKLVYQPDIYIVNVGEQAQQKGVLVAEQLRDQLPGMSILSHCGGGSF